MFYNIPSYRERASRMVLSDWDDDKNSSKEISEFPS